MGIKRHCRVVKVGGTVISVADGVVTFLGTDRLIYRVDVMDSRGKGIGKNAYRDGDFCWMFCVQEANLVLMIYPKDQGEPEAPDYLYEVEV